MILEMLAIGLVASAFLAVYLEEAVYSVASLGCTFTLISILYFLRDAAFVAVFQISVGVGMLAVLFLSGDMLSEKPSEKKPLWKTLLAALATVTLSLPPIFFFTATPPTAVFPDVLFAQALWNLRSIDIVLQGLVMLTVSLGIAIVLHEKRESVG